MSYWGFIDYCFAINHHFFIFSVSAPEFDVSEIEALFTATVQKPVDKSGGRRKSVGAKPEKVQLVMFNILNTWLLPDIHLALFWWRLWS